MRIKLNILDNLLPNLLKLIFTSEIVQIKNLYLITGEEEKSLNNNACNVLTANKEKLFYYN